jgi:hypothetical protein
MMLGCFGAPLIGGDLFGRRRQPELLRFVIGPQRAAFRTEGAGTARHVPRRFSQFELRSPTMATSLDGHGFFLPRLSLLRTISPTNLATIPDPRQPLRLGLGESLGWFPAFGFAPKDRVQNAHHQKIFEIQVDGLIGVWPRWTLLLPMFLAPFFHSADLQPQGIA